MIFAAINYHPPGIAHDPAVSPPTATAFCAYWGAANRLEIPARALGEAALAVPSGFRSHAALQLGIWFHGPPILASRTSPGPGWRNPTAIADGIGVSALSETWSRPGPPSLLVAHPGYLCGCGADMVVRKGEDLKPAPCSCDRPVFRGKTCKPTVLRSSTF